MYVIGGLLKQVVIYKHLFKLEKRRENVATDYKELLKMSLWEERNDDNPISSRSYVRCVEEGRNSFRWLYLCLSAKRKIKETRFNSPMRQ